MTPAKLLRHRLHNQRLAATTFEDPADPVRWLGEVLDAFGPIGGHNVFWAWATGRAAGEAAARRA